MLHDPKWTEGSATPENDKEYFVSAKLALELWGMVYLDLHLQIFVPLQPLNTVVCWNKSFASDWWFFDSLPRWLDWIDINFGIIHYQFSFLSYISCKNVFVWLCAQLVSQNQSLKYIKMFIMVWIHPTVIISSNQAGNSRGWGHLDEWYEMRDF